MRLLASLREWLNYLNLIRAYRYISTLTELDDEWLGAFMVPRNLQQQTVTVYGVHNSVRLVQPAQ